MSKLLIIILSMFSAAAFAGMPSGLASDPFKSYEPFLMAMGPDPGGHTGAGVTPETTKTGRPEVDAGRTAASGANVENNSPANPAQSKQSGATAKPAN
jgi:hypothetical protein